MFDKILNYIAVHSPLVQNLVIQAQKAEAASRKIEQGYREGWIQPRYELDVLVRNRDDIHELIKKYKEIKYG